VVESARVETTEAEIAETVCRKSNRGA